MAAVDVAAGGPGVQTPGTTRGLRAAALVRSTLPAVLVAVALAVAALAALASPARAAFGLQPDSFVAKAHPNVPLLQDPANPLRHNRRFVDIVSVRAAQPLAQAGAHPDATASFKLNLRSGVPDGQIRDAVVDTPPGFIGNPRVVPRCPLPAFANSTANAAEQPVLNGCSPASQVGVATLSTGLFGDTYSTAIYQLDPPFGTPAAFGFQVFNFGIVLIPELRSGGDYGLTAAASNIGSGDLIKAATLTFWAVPADPIHDSERWNDVTQDWGAPSGLVAEPLLSNPTYCDSGPLVTTIKVDSWQEAGHWLPEDPSDPDYQAVSPEPSGCGGLRFGGVSAPVSLGFQSSVRVADTPSGFQARLRLPYNDDPDGLASPTLRDTEVVLPEGVVINPASADGLGACSTGQVGFLGSDFSEPYPIRFTPDAAECPDSSKLGTVEVRTPLLDSPLRGAVYLAAQGDNPFGSLLAIYIAIDDTETGIVAKLAGRVEPDPVTGRLSTTFEDSPQLPFTELDLDLFGGPQASLATPPGCGQAATESSLVPWSAPHTPAVEWSDSFDVDRGCVPLGFDPSFEAGAVQPLAGGFSPFVTQVVREGANQRELGRVEVTLPKGALASLKHVDVCSEAEIASSVGKAGRVAQSSPSCPVSSQVGTTTVGAGAGNGPLFFPRIPGSDVSGRVFLTGPHANTDSPVPGKRQAAYGLAFEVPAVAGPIDLGTVMVRAAIYVDPRTAEVTVVSDRLPRILQGIVLNVRDVRVHIDRDDFTLNPSSCEEKQVVGDIHAQDATRASRSAPFQVAGCAALPFRPRLALRLTGRKQTRTGRHPGIRAQVNQTGVGEAGIEKAVVRLPKSLALDPDNAQALCEFEDGTKDDIENRCPKGSIVGRARAVSPLLKRALAGNVYFVKNIRIDPRTGNQIRTLPMIVVALRGEVAVNLYGKSSTTQGGKLVNTFGQVPDAPISRFNLNIGGGQSGILAVTRTRRANINLCAGRHTAEADIDGHNGKRHDRDIRMKTPCTKRQTRAAKRQAKRAAAKARN